MNATVIHPSDINWNLPERDPRKYDRTILAEGDSWFSLGGVPAGNILYKLPCSKRTLVVNIADPGDTMVHIGDHKRVREFRRLVAEPRFAYEWSFILLSGGGNDLMDAAGSLLVNRSPGSASAEDYVNPVALADLLAHVQSICGALVDVRDGPDSPNQDTPIYMHTYDYPTPRDSPARFLGAGIQGPWLFTAFTAAGIAPAMWQPVSDFLLDQLALAILALDCRGLQGAASRPLPNFFVVDTRNVLVRAAAGDRDSSGDWLNEIHPNVSGNGKLATKLGSAMSL